MISAVPAFQDNYIWIIENPTTRSATVVDPGDAGPVLDYLKSKGLRLEAILLTHHHADHTGGVDDLLAHAFAKDPQHALAIIGPAREAIGGLTRRVTQDDVVALPETEMSLRVIDVPGHTAGHVAYFTEHGDGGPALFCGDTLFAAGCGRLFEGTAEQMWSSLQKLAALPEQTAVYCAHEYTLSNLRFAVHMFPDESAIQARYQHVSAQRARSEATVPSTIGIERQTNPFLQCKNADAFATMRKQKDSFRG